MRHAEERFLISLCVIAAAALFVIIGVSLAESSSADDELQPGDTFEYTYEDVTLTYIVEDDDYAWVGDGSSIDIGEAETVKIPSTATYGPTSHVYTVYGINNYAFYCNSTLTSVEIPDSIEEIGESAFAGTSLSSLSFSNVCQIWKDAFCGTLIERIAIPDCLTVIYEGAFAYCSELESVSFGTGDLYRGMDNYGDLYGYKIFVGSPVKNISVDERNTHMMSSGNVVFNKTGTDIIMFPTGYDNEYTLPDTVTTIMPYSFYGCSLTGVVFPDSNVVIGACAFQSCYGLASLTNSSSDLKIGDYAFSETGLTSVTVGESISYVGNYAFSGSTSLTDATITSSRLETIGGRLFKDCTGLTTVHIGKDVKLDVTWDDEYKFSCNIVGIYGSTFEGCSSLATFTVEPGGKYYLKDGTILCGSLGTDNILLCLPVKKSVDKVNIQDNIAYIGPFAFANSGISEVDTNKVKYIYDHAFYGCSKLTSADLGDGLVYISYCAFKDCTSIQHVELPVSVQMIDNYAFSCCSSIRSVSGCKGNLGYGVFYNCSKLESITLGASTVASDKEERGLFEYCTSLNKVNLPSGMKTVGCNMFLWCKSLESITIPSSVEKIEWGAFSECTGLKTMVLPDNLKSIGDYAFYGCRSLESITIPSKVETIGGQAFYGCSSLSSMEVGKSVKTIGEYAFYESGLVSFSQSTVNVLSTIGEGAFKNCKKLTSAQIPALKSIPNELFYGCTSLESFEIGENVRSIGEYAFYRCSSLESIVFNAKDCGALEEYANAFAGTGAFSVIFGNNVTRVPNFLFYSVDQEAYVKVYSVTIGTSVARIGNQSFEMCRDLQYFIFNSTSFIENKSLTDCLKCAGTNVPTGMALVIGDDVTKIKKDLFKCTLDQDNAPKITSMSIGTNVTTIDEGAFAGNLLLSKIVFNAIGCSDLSASHQSFLNCGSSSDGISLEIGKDAKVMPSYLFFTDDPKDSPRIKSIITDGTVDITFRPLIFNGSPYLKEIDVTGSGKVLFDGRSFENNAFVERLIAGSGDVTFKGDSFNGCKRLSYIYIDASKCTVEPNTFSDTGTTGNGIDVVFGNNITNVPENLFYIEEESHRISPIVVSVTIGTSVRSIGSNAFYGCGTKVINIPDNVYEIGDHAFFGNAVRTLTIGKGVTKIGQDAFGTTIYLERLYFNAVNCSNFTAEGGPFRKAGRNSAVKTEAVFGASVTKVPEYLFYTGSTVEEDTPNLSKVDFCNVTAIGKCAFSHCYALSSITISASVQSIGYHAFENCSKISETMTINFNATDCSIPKDNAPFYNVSSHKINVNFGENVTKVPEYMFFGSSIDGDVSIDLNDIITIGSYAFSGLKLTSIDVTDDVTSIGDYAFSDCTVLTTVTIGENVTSIRSYAFSGCTSLATLYFEAENCNDLPSNSDIFSGCTEDMTVTFRDTVKRVPAKLFSTSPGDEPNIVKIVIEDDVPEIASYAFVSCGHVKTLIIGKGVTTLGSMNGLDNLSALVFNAVGCNDLGHDSNTMSGVGTSGVGFTVTFGKDVTKVPANLFYTDEKGIMPNVKSIEYLGTSVSEIGSCAFEGLDTPNIPVPEGVVTLGSYALCGAKDTNVPSSIRNIGEYAYAGSGIKVADIPEGVEVIPNGMFSECESLTTVYVPSTVTRIGTRAFYHCTGLESVDVNKDNPSYKSSDGILFNKGETTLILYPSKNASTEYTVPKSVTKLSSESFYKCMGLEKLIITSNVRLISKGAVTECVNIKYLTIPSSIVSLTDEDFTGLKFFDIDEKTEIPVEDTIGYTYIGTSGTSLIKNITITFDSNGGSDVEPIIGKAGSDILPPAEPEKKGYEFIKWQNNGVDFEFTVMPNDNILLKAVWAAKKYTVTLDRNEGTASGSVQAEYDSKLPAFTALTRTGYTLKGYYTSATSDVMVIDSKGILKTSIEPYSDSKGNWIYDSEATFYAQWTPNEYTIIFDSNLGGEPSKKTMAVTYDSAYGDLATVSRTGYTFSGWYTEISGGTLITSASICQIAKDHTLYAHWTPNEYTVKFDPNTGEKPSQDSITVTYDSAYGDLATVSKTGYLFLGWYTTATGDTLVTSTTICQTADNHTLYAHWKPIVYMVEFDANAVGEPLKAINVTYDSAYGQLASTRKAGYTFVGWFADDHGGSEVTSTTICKIAETHTLYAHWTPNEYTVTFDPNGGNVPSKRSMTVTYDSAYGDLATVSKTGYTFSGWYTTATGNTKIEDTTICDIAKDHALYAHWTPNEYKVTFYGNGSTGGSMAVQIFTYDKAQDLTENGFLRTGHSFTGWAETDSGPKVYDDKQTVKNLTDKNGGNIDLYAVWAINQYTAKFINEGNVYCEYTCDYGSEIIPPQDNPAKEPTVDTVFTFDRWEGFTPGMTMPEGGAEFTAVYISSLREYEATFMNEGSVYAKYSIGYGKTIPVPANDPKKDDDENFKYEFFGWSGYKEHMVMSGNISFDSAYLAIVKKVDVIDDTVVIPSSSVDVVLIGASSISDIKSKVESGEVSSMEIKLNEGSITLDGGAVLSMSNDNAAASLVQMDHDDLPPEIASKVEGRTVYSINLGDNHEFNGTLTITVNYTLKDGEDPNDLKITYYSLDGTAKDYSCVYKDGKITFTTDHLSYYAVTLDRESVDNGMPAWVIVIIAVVAIIGAASAIIILRKKGMFS